MKNAQASQGISSFGPNWAQLFELGMNEDQWAWDWSGRALRGEVTGEIKLKGVGASGGKAIWVGEGVLRAAEVWSSTMMGTKIMLSTPFRDGSIVPAGDVVVQARGEARALLAVERTVLNLCSMGTGIATKSERLVSLIRKASASRARAPSTGALSCTQPRLTLTRKTLPGYRDLCIYSVIVGGGHPHRVSLAGGVLIKENHIAAAGGVARAIEIARVEAPHLLKVEIEVTDLAELKQAIDAGAEVVMLDNFSVPLVEKALLILAKAGRPITVEVSGGIGEANIGSYCLPGVHVISSGAMTQRPVEIDLSMRVHPRKGLRR